MKRIRTLEFVAKTRFLYGTVVIRKFWNRKTTLKQYLSEFDVVTNNIVLL